MLIRHLPLSPAAIADVEPFRDHRGLFARFFCRRELDSIVGDRSIVNVNFSSTCRKGAIRGMHFQRYPHQEMKLVRCIRGVLYDVIVDLRKDSPTFLKWHGEILSPENMRMICVPEGFAHGFQALEANSEVLYLTTAFYCPQAEGGIRFDDPAVGIEWPVEASDVSPKDASHALISDNANLLEML